MIVADVDRFKQVNDSLGHAMGDAVLRHVAYVIRKQLRAFDLAYRIGGEEFLILLPGAETDEYRHSPSRSAPPSGRSPLGRVRHNQLWGRRFTPRERESSRKLWCTGLAGTSLIA